MFTCKIPYNLFCKVNNPPNKEGVNPRTTSLYFPLGYIRIALESPMSTYVYGIKSCGRHCQSFGEGAMKEQPTNRLQYSASVGVL